MTVGAGMSGDERYQPTGRFKPPKVTRGSWNGCLFVLISTIVIVVLMVVLNVYYGN